MDLWLPPGETGQVRLASYNAPEFAANCSHLRPLHNQKENFQRVDAYLEALKREFDFLETRERDFYEVNAKLSKITLELGTEPKENEKPPLTTVLLGAFNYADTFKYLDRYQDYVDFDKQVEILDMFAVLYDFTWVSRRKK